MNRDPSDENDRRAVLFDLDGTLTDPFPGITGSIRYALERVGVEEIPEAEALRWCIGPPLQENFRVLLGDDDPHRVAEAVHFYRQHYGAGGLFENSVIDGVPETLRDLTARGFRLFVATSKLREPAVRIVEHFGLARFFEHVYGTNADGSLSNKADLIADILERERLRASDALMVGDRKHDLAGARANGVAAIGVTYGYGTVEELRAEQPLAIAETPADVGALVVTWDARASVA
ncbi:HAD hydrolase-like protein [Breoghania sp.]|uniref:HAD hydrolase-like protein n=1 Tax=Breoghania sp. TaxID=2065378 RepID=UPI002AA5EC5B|nr:HAD hydrolase-like protein [Breoghania sp.]